MILRYANIITQKDGKRIIKVQFPYSFEDLAFIKTFSNRKWLGEEKRWLIPISLENTLALLSKQFQIGPQLSEYLKISKQRREEAESVPMPTFKEGLSLRPYQVEGIRFIEKSNGRALIADEMGLGKTIEAIGWCCLHPELKKVLVCVPSSLKIKWSRECLKWMDRPSVQILQGQTPFEVTGDVVIINHDILSYWQSALRKLAFDVLIVDEIHHFKNPTAQRTKALNKVAKGIQHIIGISGTPIQNRPVEIYNVGKLINSTALPNYIEFTTKFCNRYHNGFGWDVSGSSNIPELFQLLSNTFMIRRLKKDVTKELPDKQFTFVPFEIDNRKEYQQAEDDFLTYIGNKIDKETENTLSAYERARLKLDKIKKVSNAQTLVKVGELKQLAVKGKMVGVIEWLEDFLNSGEKLIVFVSHIFVSDMLRKAFPDAIKIDGSITGQKRQDVVDAFQNDPKVKLLIGNHKAAGEGLDLTAASNVAILEFPWTPGAVDQDIDRVHRIGQKADKVNVYYLVGVDTIEEQLAKLIDKKRKIVQGTLDGTAVPQDSLLNELLNTYKNQSNEI